MGRTFFRLTDVSQHLSEHRGKGYVYAFDLDATDRKKYEWHPEPLKLTENQHCYEVLFAQQPRYPFCDVEWASETPASEEEIFKRLSALNWALSTYIRQYSGLKGEAYAPSIIISGASGHITKKGPWQGLYKNSFHLVLMETNAQKRVVIRNLADWVLFWNVFDKLMRREGRLPEDRFANQDYFRAHLFYTHPRTKERLPIYDACIIKHRQCWRMLHQTKGSDLSRPLKPCNGLFVHQITEENEDPLKHLVTAADALLHPNNYVFMDVVSGTAGLDGAEIYQREKYTGECIKQLQDPDIAQAIQTRLQRSMPPTFYREIGLRDANGVPRRPFWIKGDAPPGRLHRLIHEIGDVTAVEVGAFFDVSDRHKAKHVGKELVFDIDMTDFGERRPCTCANSICDMCAVLLEYGVVSIIWVLEHIFDYSRSDIRVNFSGRRGAHIWINDDRCWFLTDEQRRFLVDYIVAFLAGGHHDSAMQERFYKEVTRRWYAWFLRYAREWTNEWTQKVLADAEQRPSDTHLEMRVLRPILDVNVTKQVQHLLKAPELLHPKTNQWARIVPRSDNNYKPNSVYKFFIVDS